MNNLEKQDTKVFVAIEKELDRQQNTIELIASENIVSKAILAAQGSVLTNKYAEGYPGKRYYGGCEYVDIVETLAIERLKQLFNCQYANVQPHSGSQANQAVFNALLKPGDIMLGMSLSAGGHLTHGAAPNQSGKWFHSVQYGVRKEDALIDYEEVEKLAQEHKPKLIIAGASAYSRHIDFKRFKEIADKVGALFMADIAHYAGLIVAGEYPSPFPYADVVTSTTHKTLRGPRGGVIMTNNEEFNKKINSAIFPGIQGGPLMHVIAAKAIAFKEALHPDFKSYAKQVVANAKVLSNTLLNKGLDIVTKGTDSHMILLDLRPLKITGNIAEATLERSGITCNKNAIPFDPEKPTITSGIRLGTAACTTRGFKEEEFITIGNMIHNVLKALQTLPNDNSKAESEAYAVVQSLCKKFPIYS